MDTWLSRDSQFLTLGWSQIAECGMASLAIVKNFDIFKDFGPSLLTGVLVPAMDEFHFQSVEKTFGHRVIPAISLPAHTALDARGFE